MKNTISRSQKLIENLGAIIAATPPGERLLSEPYLAKQLGVSRATLREAMRTYETQGLIHRRQGSGTYVLRPSQGIQTGLEVLESIGTIAERIGLDVSMGELGVITRSPTAEEAQALAISPDDQVVHLSRVIHAEGRPVAYLIDIVPREFLDPADLGESFSGSVLDIFLRRGSPRLSSSRCEINADTATHDVARSLGIQRRDVLLRLIAYLYSTDGRVVDYSYSYFLPGYFRFHVVRRVG